jgi:hypothetical protein
MAAITAIIASSVVMRGLLGRLGCERTLPLRPRTRAAQLDYGRRKGAILG